MNLYLHNEKEPAPMIIAKMMTITPKNIVWGLLNENIPRSYSNSPGGESTEKQM